MPKHEKVVAAIIAGARHAVDHDPVVMATRDVLSAVSALSQHDAMVVLGTICGNLVRTRGHKNALDFAYNAALNRL